MAKTKEQKIKMVEDLVDKIQKSKSIFLVNYEGLKVSDIKNLKRKLKKELIDYMVAKKTLFKIAAQKSKLNIDPKKIAGNFALIFSYADEIAPSKILVNFSKENENLKIVAGVLNDELISADKIVSLSKLPGKIELLSKLVGSLNSPVYGFVNVLSGNLRGLVQILSQIKK
jgi:large subunit ribosomal protein L10